jgi:Na+/H+ antiporter NhaD/arsenite permease-like protein
MVIGALSGIPYPMVSAAALSPIAAFGLLAVIAAVRLVYRRDFVASERLHPHPYRDRTHPGQMVKATVVCVALAITFLAGVPPSERAMIGRAFLLVTRAIEPARIYRVCFGVQN